MKRVANDEMILHTIQTLKYSNFLLDTVVGRTAYVQVT